jgi:hypothetical protein
MLPVRANRFPPNLLTGNFDLRLATSSETVALSDFLRRIFQRPSSASFHDESHLAWKYWSDRPDWPGSRSFTARHDGAIVAHAAAWPVRVRVPGQIVPAVHLIDWAADPKYSGVGIWLVRQISAKTRLMIATGGTPITQRVLPVIGFRRYGDIDMFARPVRPLRQALTTSEKNWRLAARLLRNTCWQVSQPLSVPRGWSARPLAPEAVPQELWPQPSASTAVTARDAAFYRYVMDSPCARHVLFGLENRGALVGYFCLAFSPHVARIADLWLPSTTVEDWSAAFRTAAATAAAEEDVYEVSAWASTPIGKTALVNAGFRSRDRSLLTLKGETRSLEGRTLHIQMLDCDASFLSAETGCYLT